MLKEWLQTFALFFRMGAVTFGGGYAILPILRRELVQSRGWLSDEELMDYYAISQGLPGLNSVNVSLFIGYHRRKTPGAVAAALGVVSPSVAVISIIAFFLSSFQDNVYVRHALAAISVCVVALILDTVVSMWKKGVKDALCLAVCLAVLLLSLLTGASTILLIVASALLGILVRGVARARARAKGGDAK